MTVIPPSHQGISVRAGDLLRGVNAPRGGGNIPVPVLCHQSSDSIAPSLQHLIPAVDFASLYAPIDADMRAVDAVVRTRLHSEVVLVRQVAEYIISAGGKRMRPALVLLTAGALGYRGTHHYELAAVIEFIH